MSEPFGAKFPHSWIEGYGQSNSNDCCALTNTENYTISGKEKVTNTDFYCWAIHCAKRFTLFYYIFTFTLQGRQSLFVNQL